MFLAQAMSADHSCQNIVNQSAVARVAEGLLLINTNTGAYCKARQRLPLEMISELVRFTERVSSDQAPESWRWRGRPVKLIDGATTTMPDTPENQKVFPRQTMQELDLGFPICRIVGITCLSSGTILDFAIGPYSGKGTGEQGLLRQLIDHFVVGSVVIGGAYYFSYFLLVELMARGVDCVFEQNGQRNKSTDLRRGQRLDKKDHLITYCKPKQKPERMSVQQYRTAPDSITVLEIEASNQILLTTFLSSKDVPKQEVKALYKGRWHVELDLRNIKTTLGMETLSCKVPDMVVKEIWVYFLTHNLIRIIMAQAATLYELILRQLSLGTGSKVSSGRVPENR